MSERPAITIARLIGAADDADIRRTLANVYISDKRGYVFFSNPKAACSTIKHVLFKEEAPASVGWKTRVNVHQREFSPLLGLPQAMTRPAHELEAPIFSFCFVRNPFSRLYSAYVNKIAKDTPHRRQIMATLGVAGAADVSFAEFTRAVADMPEAKLDGHWGVQTKRLKMDRFAYAFVGAFERLEPDLAEVFRRIGAPAPAALPKRNSSRYVASVSEVIDDATADLIRARYRSDFDILGYSEDPADAQAPPEAV